MTPYLAGGAAGAAAAVRRERPVSTVVAPDQIH